MHPNHICFPVLSCPSLTLMTLSSKKLQFLLSVYSLKCDETLNGLPPKIGLSPSPPSPLLEAIYCGDWHFSILWQFLRVLFHGFLFKQLLFLEGGMGGVEVGFVTAVFHVVLSQLCICGHRYHCQSCLFALYGLEEHESWACTWFLVSEQMINRDPGCIRTPGPRQGPLMRLESETSTWLQATA